MTVQSVRSVLILKCVGPNGEAYGNFRWPLEVGATVTAPDWDPSPTCGGGLHGWLFGEGDLGQKRSNLDLDDPLNKWLVLEALATDVIEFDRKCKARSVTIIFVGERSAAATYIAERHRDKCVHYATITAGDEGTATAGYGGTATAGDEGTAKAGSYGTATAGIRGTAMAGIRGMATAGYGGTATAGYGGTATAGDHGMATAGYGGTATAGIRGTATAGDGGTLTFFYWDNKRNKRRTKSFEVGDGGLKPNVKYRLKNKQPVKVSA